MQAELTFSFGTWFLFKLLVFISSDWITAFAALGLTRIEWKKVSYVSIWLIYLIAAFDVQRSIHLHQIALICIHAACNFHKNTQINMANIYIEPIYIFSRLHICIYALHICIYGNMYPCAQSVLHIYIYIYIYIYISIYIYMQHKT